jgi:hypothetical protein
VKHLVHLLVGTLAIALAQLAGATTASAAPASVTIESPAEGSSVYGTDLTVSGKAKSPTGTVWVTVQGDPNTYQPGVTSRGTWAIHVNELPAGTRVICAEVRDTSGQVVARDCNTFTVTADPSRFQIAFPEEGAVLGSTVYVAVQCVTGTTVRLTLDDAQSLELPCENWGVDHTYTNLAEGSHSITAAMVDQGAVVATRTRTFTVDLPDAGTVKITSPADGSSGFVGPVDVSGTASSWNNAVYLFIDDVESYLLAIDGSGGWQVSLDSLALGSHSICAATKDPAFVIDARDCITYTVKIDPSRLTITSPEEGSLNGPSLVVQGLCAEGTQVVVSVDGAVVSNLPCDSTYQVELSGLTDGTHRLSVSMRYGGETVATLERSFAVDALAPATPVVTSPSTKKTITSPTLTLVGTAEPLSTVEVATGDGMSSWTTTADQSGGWTLTLNETFFEAAGALTGQRTKVTVIVTAIDAFGNRSAPGSYTYTVHIR